MVAPALPVPTLDGWTLRRVAGAAPGTYTAWHGGEPLTRLELRRVAGDRLRNCYPYGEHDLAVRVHPAAPRATVVALLRALVPALFAADPRCRRVVAAPAENDAAARAVYVAGGLRQVAEADLPEGTVVLLTAEPPQLAELPTSLADMPH
ncbi:GNAT family N-acetyltransferase [Embleya sp. AB8]|uniref:GNAT family N-acetyltransferase n=1 Tax=Embleya sp. AB8 TaxID=3156304 RepID=UPI003C727A06